MNVHQHLIDGFDRLRDGLYARWEALFPRAVEVRLIEILGGTTMTLGNIRHNNRPMTIVFSQGRLLRSRHFRRTVIDGRGVLAGDVRWAIMIQGPEYEHDVLMAFERDERLKAEGWRLAYVTVKDLWQNPERVRQKLLPVFA